MTFTQFCADRARRFLASFRWWPEGDRPSWFMTFALITSFGLLAVVETLEHARIVGTPLSFVIACFLARASCLHWNRSRKFSQQLFQHDVSAIRDVVEGCDEESLDNVRADLAAFRHKIATGYYDA